MISGFFLIICMGPIALLLIVSGKTFMFASSCSRFIFLMKFYFSTDMTQVMTVQIKCFEEIITIGYRVYHSYDLPWFRTLSW